MNIRKWVGRKETWFVRKEMREKKSSLFPLSVSGVFVVSSRWVVALWAFFLLLLRCGCETRGLIIYERASRKLREKQGVGNGGGA